MCKPRNIYWVTETEDENFISMQSPGRCLFPSRKKCFKNPISKTFIIDNSNTISVEQENEQTLKNNRVEGGDINTGAQSNSSVIDATQVSVIVVVPIIDSFDYDAIPLNEVANQYRVAAGGQNLDIQVNGDGTAFINGEEIEESELGDGTRVFIYRNNKVENDIENDKE